jgi:hypothetical protein
MLAYADKCSMYHALLQEQQHANTTASPSSATSAAADAPRSSSSVSVFRKFLATMPRVPSEERAWAEEDGEGGEGEEEEEEEEEEDSNARPKTEIARSRERDGRGEGRGWGEADGGGECDGETSGYEQAAPTLLPSARKRLRVCDGGREAEGAGGGEGGREEEGGEGGEAEERDDSSSSSSAARKRHRGGLVREAAGAGVAAVSMREGREGRPPTGDRKRRWQGGGEEEECVSGLAEEGGKGAEDSGRQVNGLSGATQRGAPGGSQLPAEDWEVDEGGEVMKIDYEGICAAGGGVEVVMSGGQVFEKSRELWDTAVRGNTSACVALLEAGAQVTPHTLLA